MKDKKKPDYKIVVKRYLTDHVIEQNFMLLNKIEKYSVDSHSTQSCLLETKELNRRIIASYVELKGASSN